jgi:hypothetical protein
LFPPSESYADPAVRAERPRIGWHPLDPVSLVAGLIAVAFAVGTLFQIDVDAGIAVPIVLVAAGVVGLVTAVLRDRRDP